MLFLTVCLLPFFAHVWPISFCFRLLSSLGAFSCQSLLSIPSFSFYLLGLLCIFFRPSCFLLSVSSLPVSLLVPMFPMFLSHIMPSTLFHAAAPACTLLYISLLHPPSLQHCTAQVYKTVHLFNGLSVNNYMQVHLLFAYPHCFGLFQIHLEAMFSKGVIPFLQCFL